MPPGGMAPPPGMMPQGNPLMQLAQRGQGGMPDPMMMFLTFSAGVGFPELVRAIEKMRNPPKSKDGKGVGADAQRAPMQTIPPQLAQLLASRAQTPSQGVPPGALTMGALR